MKITIRDDLPGFINLRDPVHGQSMDLDPDVHVDGVLINSVVTVDSERGFVDYFPSPLTVFGENALVHRIFGKVTLVWPQQKPGLFDDMPRDSMFC